jgi:hypothetical protein
VLAVRAAHPVLWDPERWGSRLTTFGANGGPDVGHESRSIAWAVDGLYVMANMWWEPVEFTVQVQGDWRVLIDTTSDVVNDPESAPASGPVVTVGPRSIVVLAR